MFKATVDGETGQAAAGRLETQIILSRIEYKVYEMVNVSEQVSSHYVSDRQPIGESDQVITHHANPFFISLFKLLRNAFQLPFNDVSFFVFFSNSSG